MALPPLHQRAEIGCQLGSHLLMLPDAGMIVVAIAQRAVLIGEVESSLLFNILSIQFEVAFVLHIIAILFLLAKLRPRCEVFLHNKKMS